MDKSVHRELQVTADGSHTFFIPEMDEHYHSVNGAIQEALHVFLRAGFDLMTSTSFHVLEFGFGTGLNAWLTLLEAEKKWCKVQYTTIEKYPLEWQMAAQLNYADLWQPEAEEDFLRLHRAPWNESVEITPGFCLHKILGDYQDSKWPDGVDLVYFDAFAPDKQPEVWNQSLFDRIYRSMNEGGVLVTYCAKGAVRRMWQAAGFSVERIPGPPGKREMLRAWK